MNIAIGIITQNRPKKLYRLLYSLVPQLKNNHKVFILENGSNTIEKNKIKTLGIKNFELIKKKDGNIPKYRNYLLQKTKNNFDILLFIDDDCITSKNWIKKYESVFKNNKTKIVQGAITSIPSNNMFAQSSGLLFKLWLSKNTTENTTKIIDTKNVGLRIKSLENTMFNENLKFASDIDLAAKLASKGIIINSFKSSLIFHEERTNLKEFMQHRIKLSFAYRIITKKYINHFESAKVIEKYWYLWKNLDLRINKRIFILSSLFLSHLFVFLKSIPQFSGHSKP